VLVVVLSVGSLGVDMVIDRQTAERTSLLLNDSLRSITLADDLRSNAYRLSTAGVDQAQLVAIARQIDADARAFDPIATSVGERDEWNRLQSLLAHLRHEPGTTALIPEITKSIAHLVEINQATARSDADAIGSIHDRGLWVDVGVGIVTLGLAIAIAFALIRALRAQRTLLQTHLTELEAFAGRTAHDLRGPLSPVRGYADLLSLEASESTRGYAGKIRKAADRMDGIIDDLLALSVSGKPRPGSTRVSSAIKEALGELAAELVDADVEVVCDEGVAEVSSGVLAQLLRNLVGNAAKYRSPDRKLALSITGKTGSRIEIVVRDNGIGMSAEAAQHAFDPYFRADADAPVAGHGLGLAIVRRTVEACGGDCDLASQPGVGTTVTLRLLRHDNG
jgi:signal transduction histidine kinase